MPIGPDKVRLHTTIDRRLAEKIHELAERMALSDSAMAYVLLEEAVADKEWIIRLVTNYYAKRAAGALGILGKDRQRFIDAQDEGSEA